MPSRLVILLNLDVLHASGLEKIGDPHNIDNSAAAGAAAGSEGARQQAAPAAARPPCIHQYRWAGETAESPGVVFVKAVSLEEKLAVRRALC